MKQTDSPDTEAEEQWDKAKKKLARKLAEKKLNCSDAMHVSMAVCLAAACESAGCK